MSKCILCNQQGRKTNLVSITQPVIENVSLAHAIQQQMQINSFPQYQSKSTDSSCKTCFNHFKTFYQFFSKVKSNLSTFETSIPANEVILKMEVDVKNIKVEPYIHMEADENDESGGDYLGDFNFGDDNFKDDDSNFTWSEDDSTNFKDDGDISKFPVVGISQKDQQICEKAAAAKKKSTKSNNFEDDDSNPYWTEDDSIDDPTFGEESKAKKRKMTQENAERPKTSKRKKIRVLPRSEVTQEMRDSNQEFVVINGIKFKIPPKESIKCTYTGSNAYNNDPSRRKHPNHDPEGEEKIRNFIDLKCYICGDASEIQTSFTNLKKHFRIHHPKIRHVLHCCKRKFRRRCDLMDHIEYHENLVVPHACEICKKTYKSKKSLKCHQALYHSNNPSEKVMCDECGKICISEKLLKSHMLTHLEDETKTFVCYICNDDRTFKNHLMVRNHLRNKHSGRAEKKEEPKLGICHICSATIRVSYLPTHMRIVHGENNRERIQCTICGSWLLKSSLKLHMKLHSDMGVTCEICGKHLKSTSMYEHMKQAHSENYKFRCEHCGKGFFKENKMLEHVAVKHTREFPWRCRVAGCDRQFRSEANWKNHEKKFHPEEYAQFFKPYYKRAPEEMKTLKAFKGN